MRKLLYSKNAIAKTQAIIIAAIIIIAVIAGAAYYYFFMIPKAPAKEYIVIGRTLAFTGKYSKPALMARKGWDLWMEDVNAKGGIYVKELGRRLKVKTIYYDDESDPSTAAELYRKLIEVDKVDLIVGPYASSVNYAVQPIAESYKMIMPICEGTSTKLYTRGFKYSFMCGAGGVASHYHYRFFEWLSKLPSDIRPKKIAILAEDTAFPRSVAEGAKEFAAEFGFEVVYEEYYPKGTTDFVPIVTKARDAGAEVLVCGTYFPDAAGIVRACKEIGWAPKAIFCTVGPALPEWGTELGSDGDYVFSATDFVPITPEGKEFYEKFKKKYGIEPSYHAARDYSMGMMLQQAIEAVGSLDQDKLLEYFMSGVKFKTLFGEITIGSYRDLKGITWPPSYYIVQWQNGKMVVVLPEDYAQAKPIFPMPSWEERGG